jgi:hypothetical protein
VAHLSGHHALGAHTHDGAGTTLLATEEDTFRSSLNGALSNLGEASRTDLVAFRQRHYAHEQGVHEQGVHEHGVHEHGVHEHGVHEHGVHEHGANEHGDANEDAEFEHLGSASTPHGSHSVAHRDLAAASPPVPPLAPGAVYLVPALREANLLSLALPRVVSAFRARGPPA